MFGEYDSPGTLAPAELPVSMQQAVLFERPVYTITAAPTAAVVLVEIDVLNRQ